MPQPPRTGHALSLALLAALLQPTAQAAPGQLHPDVHYDARSNTLRVVGCDYPAVKSALLNVSDGGTVEIGAGHCDWGEEDPAHPGAEPHWVVASIQGKNIRVRGAGVDQTVIHRTSPIRGGDEPLLYFGCGSGATIEMSHIHFLGNDDEQAGDPVMREADQDSGIQLQGRCQNIKLHDMVFEKFSNAGLTVRGPQQRGVIHDNSFLSNFKCVPGCWGYGVAVYGDGSDDWPPLQLGTAEAVFIEDNYFHDNRHGVAANYGSAYVVRHNLFVSTRRTRDYGQIDAHGPSRDGDGVRHPGSRSWEIYENEIHGDGASGNPYGDGIALRGGDGVIYNNKVKGYVPYAASLNDDDCSGSRPQPYQTTAAYIWSDHWDEDWEAIPGYDPDKVWIGCPDLLEEGSDWHLDLQPPGYQAFPYPHPLRP